MKKANVTSLALLAYLLVMSIIGWPGRANAHLNYTEYFCMIGATLVVIILLRFLQAKRRKMRDKWKEKETETDTTPDQTLPPA
ncbi:hypothetical protein LJC44_05565 [Parabacteroides sp. OttesenSCG-928-G06]|nr:hypothetical protein [Parabacteroides sp. OttesenSCG-928-K15]MDL2282555.1 hypothetical protein [Parabacteroides sp. OttesenSCG-928-G06]